MEVADALRIAILIEGGLVLGLSAFVLRLYVTAVRLLRDRGTPVAGALPYHVGLVATSHSLLIVAQIAVVERRIGGEVVWWGAPIALVAFTLSLAALVDMLRFQQLRIRRIIEPDKEA